MIILVSPMFSNYRNLNADSCYVFIKNVITEIIKKEPKWYFILLWPREGFKYYDDGFFNNPQVKRIPIDIPQRKMDSVVHFNILYWRKLFRLFTPDIIWNHIPEQGHLFKNLYTGFDIEMSGPKIINQHHYIIHPTLPYPIDTYRAVQFQSMGSFLVDMNLFNSDYCYKMFCDVKQEILATNIRVPYRIIKFALIPENYPEPNPETQFIKIAYNHRLQDYKNYLTTFEMLAQLWTTYKNFRVLVTNPNASNFNKLLAYPFVDGKAFSKHEDYLKELSTCHLNITNSQHETFCISALESLAFGQILVAPRAITFPELVPKEDYPYLFSTEEEQYRILDKIFSNPSVFDTERERIKNNTRTAFANHILGDKIASLFKEMAVYEWEESSLRENSALAVKKIQHKNKGFVELTEIQKQFGEYNLGWQAFPLLKIKRVLNKLGYEDVLLGHKQGFYFG